MAGRITLGLHTAKHAELLKERLAKEGIEVTIKPVKIDVKLVEMPVAMEVATEDLTTALRIIENLEIFSLHDEKIPITVKPRKKVQDLIKVPELIKGKKTTSGNSRGCILLPVDFTDRSLTAAKVAFPLAAQLKTPIVFMHAYVLPSAAETFSLSPDTIAFEPRDMELDITIEETARAQMDNFTGQIRDYIKDGIIPPVKFSVEIQEGVPEGVINDYVKENDVRLIVMGTRAAEKKERELIGSITAEVLDTVRCPVLTIPENAQTKIDSLHEVAFFCNLDKDDITALNVVNSLFPESSFHITFYYIATRKDKLNIVNPNESMMKLKSYCKAKFRRFTFDTKEIKPGEAKEIFSDPSAGVANFLVVPGKKRHALARLFNPGLAHRLLFVADIDMLVVPV